MNPFNYPNLVQAYSDALNMPKLIAVVPEYENPNHRVHIACRMIANVRNDASRHDWLRYNPAMRKAAKSFGFTKTRDFKAALQSLPKGEAI